MSVQNKNLENKVKKGKKMSHNHSNKIEIDDKLHIFYISFDILDHGYGQVKEKFYNELFDDIPAFAFGTDVMNRKKDEIGLVPTVREAMNKIYSIKEMQEASKEYLNSNSTEDKYIRRGEFGELLLYHILHEYFEADALISKIYFKDSPGSVAHGFDAVHVDTNKEIIWLGESKLYKNPATAIKELANDVVNHFNVNFLTSEFQIITNRIHDSKVSCDPYILKLLDPNTKFLDTLAKVHICLFAGFESNSLIKFDKDNFESMLRQEVDVLDKKMKGLINQHNWGNYLNIYLMAFPLDNKREFVSSLHQKLKGAQQI
ncbi:HamA C-terminal domain-containing protein [Granulicatella adiacens]